jgi:hypothetical protein
MSNKKQLICVFIPVISQNEVFLLGAKNKIKAKGNKSGSKNGSKETVRTLINGTIEKYETPVAAAKRVMYDKFDMILDVDVPAKVFRTRSNDVKEVHYVYIDKLFDFEEFPLVNVASDIQEVILVNEDTELTYDGESEVLADFLDSDEIDERFGEWEHKSKKSIA